MKFLEMFKNQTTLRYVIFGVILFAVAIGISFIDSNDDVKVTFDSESVIVKSDRYQLSIDYADIAKVELAKMPDAGNCTNGKDTMVLRTGTWENEAWGEYYVCADLDCTDCIVVTIHDGRTFVFSSKNNQTTAELYEILNSHLK